MKDDALYHNKLIVDTVFKKCIPRIFAQNLQHGQDIVKINKDKEKKTTQHSAKRAHVHRGTQMHMLRTTNRTQKIEMFKKCTGLATDGLTG